MVVKDFMREAVCLSLDATLSDVVNTMQEKDVDSILITHDDGTLAGSVDTVTLIKAIVPEYIGNRDMSVAGFTNDNIFKEFIEDNKDKKVKYFLLDTPKTLSINSSELEATIKATEGRQARIPVLDESGKPVGVITRRSVRKILADKLSM